MIRSRSGQAILGLAIARKAGESKAENLSSNAIFRATVRGDDVPDATASNETLSERWRQRLAAEAKRRLDAVADDFHRATAAALPAQLQRVREWQWFVATLLEAGAVPGPEGQLSGRQLCHPSTLTDWLAVLDVMARSHRVPDWVQLNKSAWEEVSAKLDSLAAMVAKLGGAR